MAVCTIQDGYRDDIYGLCEVQDPACVTHVSVSLSSMSVHGSTRSRCTTPLRHQHPSS